MSGVQVEETISHARTCFGGRLMGHAHRIWDFDEFNQNFDVANSSLNSSSGESLSEGQRLSLNGV